MNEVNNDKTTEKFRMNLFLEVFRLFVLLPSSINKLIQDRCTWRLIMKTSAAYVYVNEQLRQCMFLCFGRYFLVLNIHLLN